MAYTLHRPLKMNPAQYLHERPLLKYPIDSFLCGLSAEWFNFLILVEFFLKGDIQWNLVVLLVCAHFQHVSACNIAGSLKNENNMAFSVFLSLQRTLLPAPGSGDLGPVFFLPLVVGDLHAFEQLCPLPLHRQQCCLGNSGCFLWFEWKEDFGELPLQLLRFSKEEKREGQRCPLSRLPYSHTWIEINNFWGLTLIIILRF